MQLLSRQLYLFIALIFVIALGASAWSVSQIANGDWMYLLLFGALTLIADLLQVQTAGGVYVSLSFTMIMVAIAGGGPFVGILVSLIAAVLSDLLKGKHWLKVVFNGSQFAVMALIAGLVLMFGGWNWALPLPVTMLIFTSATIVGALVNMLLTAVPLAMTEEVKVSKVFGCIFSTIVPVFPLQVILGFMLAYTFAHQQYHWFTLLLAVLGLIAHSYKVNRRMVDTARVTNTVLNSVSIGIVTVDETTRVVSINRFASEMFDLNPAEVIGKDYHQVFYQEYLSILMETLRSGKVYNDYEVVVDKRKVYRLQTNQLRESENGVAGAILFIQDISERRNLEEQVRQAEKLSIVGELAAGTAHEIRNPLTSVRGFIQLLKDKCQVNGWSKEQMYTDIILDELDRVNVIISEFLSLSKPTKPDLRIIDIKSILDELAMLTESEALLKNVVVQMDVAEQLPLLIVEIDQIKQVFLNLIGNAFGAMPKGGSLKISARYCDSEGQVHIAFSDTGVGMHPDVQSKIFEPFFTTKEAGTGLGLTVTYRIVQNHGGTIDVKSTLGEGTTFTVKLPIKNSQSHVA